MNNFGHVALAAVAAVLAACASPPVPSVDFSPNIAAIIAAMPMVAVAPFVSDFDAMRAALPAFDLQRGGIDQASQTEVSVVRDLIFATDDSILSRSDVTRLLPLQTFLVANPLVEVRIVGYGDGVNSVERDTDLSKGRAQAVARALLANTAVANKIDTVSAPMPQLRKRSGHAEITFIEPVATYVD